MTLVNDNGKPHSEQTRYVEDIVMAAQLDENLNEYGDYYTIFKLLNARNIKEDLSKRIYEAFLLVEDPYKFLLFCFRCDKDVYTFKAKSLCSIIAKAFQQYVKENTDKLPNISVDLQQEAYLLAKEATRHDAVKTILTLFNLHLRKRNFLSDLRKELSSGNYGFVCTACICMKLQEEISSLELLVPLYFRNSSNLLRDFMTSSPSQSESFLIILDKYVSEEFSFSDIKLLVPNDENMTSKSLTEVMKYALTVLKDYKIKLEVCPYIMNCQIRKTISYLFKKFFCLKEITKFSFFLFLKDFIIKLPTLENYILCLFDSFNDEEVCSSFIKFQNGDFSWQEICYEDDNESDDHYYYKLAIPKSSIYFVNKLEDFESSIDQILKCDVVGIDCEWHPTTFIGSKEELSLVQIAVEDAVYIFDLYILSKEFSTEHWTKFGHLFSCGILKLTYGFNNDLKILSNINKTLASHLKIVYNLVDFDNIKETLLCVNPSLFPFTSYLPERLSKGLSELVYSCFGVPLNKVCQFSYWLYRPLGSKEIEYAAVDAHCLIEIKKYLDGISAEMGLGDWITLKRSLNGIFEIIIYNSNPVAVHELKLACDPSLQGLGRMLRHCGIDTKVLVHTDHYISVYQKEGRIVLLDKTSRQQSKYLPEKSYHLVTGENVVEQMQNVVTCFKIEITEMDFFSRCADCNSNCYLTVTKEIIDRMKRHSNDENSSHLSEDRSVESGNWISVEGGKVNCRRIITDAMVAILVDDIPLDVVEKCSTFYICGGCGKCYWDGSHHENLLRKMLTYFMELRKLFN